MSDIEVVQTTPDESTIVLVSSVETGGRVALVEIHLRQGRSVPVHRHHWEDEIIYVLQGEVTFHLDGERRPGPAGTCQLFPRGSEHTYALQSEEAKLLVVAAPAGLEDFFVEQRQSRMEAISDIEWLVTTGAKYGLEVTGPPPAPTPRTAAPQTTAGDGCTAVRRCRLED